MLCPFFFHKFKFVISDGFACFRIICCGFFFPSYFYSFCGGYIGMEVAAASVGWKLDNTVYICSKLDNTVCIRSASRDELNGIFFTVTICIILAALQPHHCCIWSFMAVLGSHAYCIKLFFFVLKFVDLSCLTSINLTIREHEYELCIISGTLQMLIC